MDSALLYFTTDRGLFPLRVLICREKAQKAQRGQPQAKMN
jgi:hypothetical protein